MTSSRADARANRERLLEAAREVFREKGTHAEIKEIAERAGVGMGTVYRNFATKQDLVAALVGEVIATDSEIVAAATAIEDPAEALRYFMDQGYQMIDRFGGLIGALLDRQQAYDFVDQSVLRQSESRLRGIIQRGLDQGVFRPGLDADFVGEFMDAALPGSYLALRRLYPAAVVRERLISLFMEGILSRPKP